MGIEKLKEQWTQAKLFVKAHGSSKVIGLLSAILLGFFTNYLWAMIENKLPIIGNTDNSFNGYWIAEFHSINVPNTTSIELLKIRRSGNDVSIYIENFNSARSQVVHILRGSGHIQGENLSSNYYYEDGALPEVGALVLHLEGTDDGASVELVGQWVQSMNRSGKVTMAVPQPYLATKCKIGLAKQIKNTLLGTNDFRNFGEIDSYVKAGDCGS